MAYKMTKELAERNAAKWNENYPDTDHVIENHGSYCYIKEYDKKTGKLLGYIE